MKKLILLLAIALVVTALPVAEADELYIAFNGGTDGYSGGGIFTGDWDSAEGGFDITGVDFGSVVDPSFGTSAITGLAPAYAGADQILYLPTPPYFDENGLSFALANGVDINLYDYFAGPFYFDSALESNPNGDIPEGATFSASFIPEPSSFVLLGSAMLLGAMFAMRRRTIV